MTSRKDMKERSTDKLGNLIRWALRERVAGASPPPWVWDRIRVRAERRAGWNLVRSISEGGYRALIAQRSTISSFLSARIVSWMWPQGRWVEWKLDPRFTRLLADQYALFLLQLAF